MADPAARPLTVAQLAERWQCSAESIYALIRKFEKGEPGGLRHFKIGPKLIRIPCPVVEGKTLADFHVDPATRLALAISKAIGPAEDRTKGGVEIYFVKSGPYLKVGYSAQAYYRMRSMLTDNPHEVELLGIIPGTKDTEILIHQQLRPWHHRNEWFRLTPTIQRAVKELCGG